MRAFRRSEARTRRIEIALIGGLLLLAAVLFLGNLGSGALWQDEAQTALIAKTILTRGVPVGTDGVNFFSQELGAEYGPGHLWRWHTWLPFYVLAPFFALLGATTLVARLPFALFGIATVLLAYVSGRDLLRSRRGGAIAGFLLATSVPFLLLSRQCRYYSLAAFFSLLALHAYGRVTQGGSRRAGVLFVLSLVALFHTHYAYYVGLLAALLVDSLLLRRASLRRVAILGAASIAASAPWIAWLATMPYGERYDVLDTGRAAVLLGSFVRQIGTFVLPWLLLSAGAALGLAGAIRKGGKGGDGEEPVWRRAVVFLLFVAANLLILSFSAPAPFFRYLAPLLPVSMLLAAWIVEKAMRLHAAVGLAIVAGLLYVQPLRDYAYELTHEFHGPVDGIVGFLEQNARPGDVVAITYEDLPVKFYTNLRVLGGLTGEDLSPARNATWVILRKHVISEKDLAVRQYLVQNLPKEKYQAIRIDAPDTPFQNRESPWEHRYRTVVGEDRVVVFRRIAP